VLRLKKDLALAILISERPFTVDESGAMTFTIAAREWRVPLPIHHNGETEAGKFLQALRRDDAVRDRLSYRSLAVIVDSEMAEEIDRFEKSKPYTNDHYDRCQKARKELAARATWEEVGRVAREQYLYMFKEKPEGEPDAVADLFLEIQDDLVHTIKDVADLTSKWERQYATLQELEQLYIAV
jgi:hypothetical protein